MSKLDDKVGIYAEGAAQQVRGRGGHGPAAQGCQGARAVIYDADAETVASSDKEEIVADQAQLPGQEAGRLAESTGLDAAIERGDRHLRPQRAVEVPGGDLLSAGRGVRQGARLRLTPDYA